MFVSVGWPQAGGAKCLRGAHAREQLAAGLAFRSLLPFLLMLPVLGALICFVVGRSLVPLSRLAQAVGRRSPSALQPLGADGQPPELRPVVAALDDLLRRLDHALSSQRAFVADAAHELRSPLTALKLQLQLAERATTDGQRAVAFCKLHERLDRATRMVQQLLAAARHESGSGERVAEQVDLLGLAQACVAERFVSASAKGIDLGVSPGGERIYANGNSDDLQILLGNLLDNALRYTPAGGRVDVAVRAEMVGRSCRWPIPGWESRHTSARGCSTGFIAARTMMPGEADSGFPSSAASPPRTARGSCWTMGRMGAGCAKW